MMNAKKMAKTATTMSLAKTATKSLAMMTNIARILDAFAKK